MVSWSTEQIDGLTELQLLSQVIQDSVLSIQEIVTSKNLVFPSPYIPFNTELEATRVLPEVERACSNIISAAQQLIFSTRSPFQSILAVSMQHQLSACLGVAAATHVAEACREAGPKGAHVDLLARATRTDPSKLARILRMLATSHIFVEIEPNVFINNCVSSTLDSGKAVKEIIADPVSKHISTKGMAAAVGHCTDEAMKAASYLQEVMLNPTFAASEEPTDTALNLALKNQKSMWEWLEEKGNEQRLLRFGHTMEGMKNAAPQNTISAGFNWRGLRDGALVVDVGGGLGSQSLSLAQKFDHLRFVIQDREPVLKDSIKFWEVNMPNARKAGRITFQVHDFFEDQPIKDASVFLMRNILHDWADKYCVQILRKLREAAAPDTRLVIVDNIMSYACVNEELGSIPGALPAPAPSPLLVNGGHSSSVAYYLDIQMIDLLNGKERTVIEVRQLMQEAGWTLAEVHLGSQSAFSTQKAVGIPA